MEQIRKEEKHQAYEQRIGEAYIDLNDCRLYLKAEIRAYNNRPNKFIKEDFYKAFMRLYGLTYPKLDNKKHYSTIIKINEWDSKIKLRRNDSGIEEGIQLSYDLQKILKYEGIIGRG